MNNNGKQIYCSSCYKSIKLSQNDMNKIEKLTTPQTFYVELDNFKCIGCMNKNYKNTPVLENRIKLELYCDQQSEGTE